MSYSVSENDIYMTRGDTIKLKVAAEYKQNGEPYVPRKGDIIRFSVKKYLHDKRALIVKDIPIGTMILTLKTEDTMNLPFGVYHYDVQLIRANGDTDTFIENRILQISPEVN